MSFATKLFGSGSTGATEAQMAALRKSQDEQRAALEAKEQKTADAEEAQRRARRLGTRRGMLAFVDDSTGLSTQLGGSGS